MKKISKIIILIALLLIIVSLIGHFISKKEEDNLVVKEIKWETLKDDSINGAKEYIIKDFKEAVRTFDNNDFTYVYPSELSIYAINSSLSYYSSNFKINFDSTKATNEEYSDELKKECTELYEQCSLKRAILDSKTYAFLQETMANNIYQENLIILSNESIIKYNLIDNKLSDDSINNIVKRFNYKSISEDKYSHCNNNTCTLDFKDLIGYKLTINYNSSVYDKADFNKNYSSQIGFSKQYKNSDVDEASILFNVIYNSQNDAINEIDDLDDYKYLGEETINNKTLKHYSSFDGETREEARDFYDIYLDIINPNLLIQITVYSINDNANEIINEFSNYEMIK